MLTLHSHLLPLCAFHLLSIYSGCYISELSHGKRVGEDVERDRRASLLCYLSILISHSFPLLVAIER